MNPDLGLDPRTTIDTYFAALRRADRAAWLATFAPDGAAEDPAGTPAKRGHAELGAFWDGVAGALTRMDFHPLSVHLCGDRAAVSWRAELAAGNDKSTVCSGIDLFEFDAQGRIAKLTGYWDPAAAFAALA
ncbi:MAG: nuclear transport factor 2 family protein [Pseudomonadota bacterium]|nr:nuclear transport factor 2 family protein [Pseudomonadota bacterium]